MRSSYIPNQHGAWAMLVIPFLFGTLAAEANLIHILLFVCWLIIYLFTFPLLQFIKTRKSKLYLRPIQIYGVLLVVAGGALVLIKPVLLLIALAYIPLFLVNIYYAKRNRERSLVNDLAAVVQFCSMVYVSYWVGGGTDWPLATKLFVLSFIYFLGTVFYVKTMIREKKIKTYYIMSVAYHSISLVFIGVVLSPILIFPLFILLIRAIVYPKMKISIMQVGVSEIVFSIIFTITTLTTLYS